jgi:hypothetical protein
MADRLAVFTGDLHQGWVPLARRFVAQGFRLALVPEEHEEEHEMQGLRDQLGGLEGKWIPAHDASSHSLLLKQAEFFVDWVDFGSSEFSLLKGDLREWSRFVDVRLRRPLLRAREFVPFLVENGRGHVFHVVTLGEETDLLNEAIRAALASVSEVLCKELLGTKVKNSWIQVVSQREEYECVADAVVWSASRPDRVKIQEIRLSRA